jgi:hypothetical protein
VISRKSVLKEKLFGQSNKLGSGGAQNRPTRLNPALLNQSIMKKILFTMKKFVKVLFLAGAVSLFAAVKVKHKAFIYA